MLCPLPGLLTEVQTSLLNVHCTGHEESQASEHNSHSSHAEQQGADLNLTMDYVKYVCDLKLLLEVQLPELRLPRDALYGIPPCECLNELSSVMLIKRHWGKGTFLCSS